MANAILTKMAARATMTISLASLANSTTAGRQSTMVSNSGNYPGSLVFVKIRTGASAPTAGSVIEVFLIRSDGTTRDDGAGATDAAITAIENAQLLGTIAVLTTTTAKDLCASFDTGALGPLGDSWGIAIRNQSGTALDSTAGNHIVAYQYYYPEVQ